MASQVLVLKDAYGVPVWATAATDSMWSFLLPADTVKIVTIPAGVNLALFSFQNNDVYVGEATFTLPTITPANSLVELIPSAWKVTAAGTLYFRAATQGYVSVKFGAAGDNTTF